MLRFFVRLLRNSALSRPIGGAVLLAATLHFSPALSAQLSDTVIVGPTGDFPTLSEVVEKLNNDGVDGPLVVRLQPGEYKEQVRLVRVRGVSSRNPITIESVEARPGRTTIEFNHTGGVGIDEHVIRIDTTDFVTIRNLTIVNRGEIYGTGVHLFGSNSIRVEGCEFIGSDDPEKFPSLGNIGVLAFQSSRVSIVDNSITGFDFAIRTLGDADTTSTTGLRIDGNRIVNTSNFAAVFLENTRDVTVSGNQLENEEFAALSIDNCDNGLEITANRIRGRGRRSSYGIIIRDSEGIPNRFLVANNEIALSDFDTVAGAVGLSLSNASHGDIVHNTVSVLGSNTDEFQVTTNTALSLSFRVDSIRVLNNIFVNLRNRDVISNIPNNNVEFDHNNYYSTGRKTPGAVAPGSPFLDTMRARYGGDSNSFEVLPCFRSRTDIRSSSSILDNAGTPFPGVTVDIEGNRRSTTTPDIGAREFSAEAIGMSGTYTVGAGGDRDFESLQAALEELHVRCVEGPVEFLLDSGEYIGPFAINEIPRVSADNPITIRSASGVREDVRLSVLVSFILSRNRLLKIKEADHLRLRDLTFAIDDSIYSGAAIELEGASDSILFDNVLFDGTDADNSTLMFSGEEARPSGLTVRNSRFETASRSIIVQGCFGFDCIDSLRTPGIMIVDNEFISTDDVSSFSQAVSLTFTISPTIERNRIRSIGSGISLTGIVGSPRIVGNDVVVRGSSFGSSSATGISISSINSDRFEPAGLIANNMVRVGDPDRSFEFSTLTGISIGQSVNLAVLFNTIVVTDSARQSAGLVIPFGSDSIDARNNLVADFGGGVPLKIKFIPRFDSVFTVDYNLLFTTGDTIAIWNDTGRVDYSTIRQNYRQDSNSIVDLPRFLGETDLHVRSDSPVRGRGIAEPDIVPTDIDGDIRSIPWPEIGADELLLLDVGRSVRDYLERLRLDLE